MLKEITFDEFNRLYLSKVAYVLHQIRVDSKVFSKIVHENRLSDLIRRIFPSNAANNPTFLESYMQDIAVLQSYLLMNEDIKKFHPDNFVFLYNTDNNNLGYRNIQKRD